LGFAWPVPVDGYFCLRPDDNDDHDTDHHIVDDYDNDDHHFDVDNDIVNHDNDGLLDFVRRKRGIRRGGLYQFFAIEPIARHHSNGIHLFGMVYRSGMHGRV